MTSLEFCYWLQGFLEITQNDRFRHLNNEQIKIVEDHLKLVFEKKTPDYNRKLCSQIFDVDDVPWPTREKPVVEYLFEGSC